MSAESNYAVWLECGSIAAALLTLGVEHVEDEVADYLQEVQGIVGDLEPLQLALTAAWLGHVGARALLASNNGDIEGAREDVRELGLSVATTATEDY